MRLFSDRRFLPPSLPHTPLLSPFWGTAAEPDEWVETRRFDAFAAEGADRFQLVTDPAQADVAVLPANWNRYITGGRREMGLAFADEMRDAGRRLLVFFDSDSEEAMPFENAIVFRPSLHRSRRVENERPLPAWSGDLIETFHRGTLPLSVKSDFPRVAFCGAVEPCRRTVFGAARSAWLGTAPDRSSEDAAFALRRAVLARLERAPALRTHFVRRRGYFGGTMSRTRWRRRAGSAWDPVAGARVRREYVENMIDSDYVVCVRGGGNFSHRFYEALCCGRVPIVIDTDCVLPFEEAIDWRSLVVWCDAGELDRLPSKIESFHRAHSAGAFADLQQRLRRLWLERLSPLGFFSHLAEQIPSC